MYAIIDIETTGTSFRQGKITEIAIFIHDGKQIVDSFSSLINPECLIPWNISRLTGITNEMVETAPKFFEVAKQIVEITANTTFIAHNVSFDYNFVREEFKRLGYDFRRKTMCTVKMSRKFLPGHRSYSLGKICYDLGINIEARHRAEGDALATVKLFELILQQNQASQVNLFNDIDYKILPRERINQIPGQTGVYYFYDKLGILIYIGKSKNIHQRVLTHLSNSTTQKAIDMRLNIGEVDWTLTGSELAALLLESDEIKKYQPIYNRAQRRSRFHYGLFSFPDDAGYINFEIRKIEGDEIPLTSFSNQQSGKKYLHQMVEQYRLCQKLCGLYQSTGACFHYGIDECDGACTGQELPEGYNARAHQAEKQLQYRSPNFFILEQETSKEQWAVIKIENGRYVGFGYVSAEESTNSLDMLHDCITNYQDNRDTQGIIRSYLNRHPHLRLIEY